jgi:SNF2 family DNA or RNA helicase
MAVLKDARDPTGMLRAWNAGEIPHLALHPASAGHGLNLQKGGAHHIAFLTMPWSGGMMKQVTGRLARRGQAAEKVYVHTALFRDTIDEEVFERVTSRLNHMEDFLDEL